MQTVLWMIMIDFPVNAAFRDPITRDGPLNGGWSKIRKILKKQTLNVHLFKS